MNYRYGSPPVNGYGYVCFVKYLAPVLPRNDQVFLYNGETGWRDNRQSIPLDLFRNVCHWKSARPFTYVLQNEEAEVNQQWASALQQLNGPPFQENAIGSALRGLTRLHGVGVPTASALLTAWNPEQFAIIDFKTLAVLGIAGPPSVESYIQFRKKLLRLKNSESELHNCALRQIEMALWHYYTVNANGQRERRDA